MQAFLPTDVSPVEHVFDLRQLVTLLGAAGYIELPADSKVLGAEVNAQGQLIVSIAHGAAINLPFVTSPLRIRHDFAEEIKLQEQIGDSAQAAKCRLVQGLQIDPEKCQKGIGLDFRRVAAQMAEEAKFQTELQTKLAEEMEQADLQSIKPNLEVAEPIPEEVPLAEPVRPTPLPGQQTTKEEMRDLAEWWANKLLAMPKSQRQSETDELKGKHPALHALVKSALDDIKDRVKTLYHRAHTFYAFRFKNDPFSGEGHLVVPFIPGEPVEVMLSRLDSIVEKDFPDLPTRFYRCFRGIIQKVYAEGTTATVETAKSYRQDKMVPIPFPDAEGAAKAA